MPKRFLHSIFLDWTEGRRTPGLVCFGIIAKPLSWLYRVGAALDSRFRYPKAARLPDKTRLVVISSPVVGGVGKTPLVAHLATVLLQRRFNTHVVTTGYMRRGEGDVSVNSTSGPATAAECGDEAVMIRQMTGAPVHVSDDVGRAVQRVGREFQPDFIVLDDGVRRRWLGEDRIVVLKPEDLERPVRFLPDGRWRISPRRAWPATGVAIVQIGRRISAPRDDAAHEVHRDVLRSWGFHGPIAWYDTMADGLVRLSGRGLEDTDSPLDESPLVFCGVGSPSRFARQIDLMGMNPRGMQRFPDHHAYTAADLADLERRCRILGARWMLTTHKDAVKIDPAWAMAIPIYWLRIRLELAAGVDMLSILLEKTK